MNVYQVTKREKAPFNPEITYTNVRGEIDAFKIDINELAMASRNNKLFIEINGELFQANIYTQYNNAMVKYYFNKDRFWLDLAISSFGLGKDEWEYLHTNNTFNIHF